jgi:hypothetical protein
MLAARFIAIFFIFIAMDVGSRRCMRRLDKPSLERATPCEGFPPQTWDVTVGQGLAFVPNTLNLTEGDTVCWTWSSNGRSVTGGINCTANGWFCSPDNMNCSQPILSYTGKKYCVTLPAVGLITTSAPRTASWA